MAQAAFIAIFPAIVGMVAFTWVYAFILSITYNPTRKRVLVSMGKVPEGQPAPVITEVMVEQEIARLHPHIYDLKQYAGTYIIGSGVIIYIVAFAVLLFGTR